MAESSSPPVLSTPATHIFEEQPDSSAIGNSSHLSEEQLHIIYEIERTVLEIKKERYARVALQFPDWMLPDAPRVFEALGKDLNSKFLTSKPRQIQHQVQDIGSQSLESLDFSSEELPTVRLYILADTSYGACCVDETAAEHICADAIIHYGRACLSPTARIPVLHIFTMQPLPDQSQLIKTFKDFYGDTQQKVVLMADVTYQHHLQNISSILESQGFSNLHIAGIVHDPSSSLPNRTVPEEVQADPSKLKDWHIFHISDPAKSLLLILASRVASILIYPTSGNDNGTSGEPFLASTSRALNRRYALLTSVNTVSIFGILINTLSVRNYLHIVEHVKSQILAARKKSYTFVVGKVNAAKMANFSEIGAWVVIGCWESSLIDSKDFWKPVLTPFELELALRGDEERVWTGEWSSDFQKILDQLTRSNTNSETHRQEGQTRADYDPEPESAPPEFDLRTGRYVSHSRPVQPFTSSIDKISDGDTSSGKSLIMRAKGDLAVVGGGLSPGAEYLRSKRTWKGLGSDFEIAYEEPGAALEEGRSGIARGYTHGTVTEIRT